MNMRSMKEIDLSEFDFMDFGSSEGNSLKFGVRHLGGHRGLGVDFDPAKVRKAQEQGFDCVCGDLTNLEVPQSCVRFVIANHVIEHLDSEEAIGRVIASAVWAARDFVYVACPWFDADEHLRTLGLKFYWSDWRAHRTHPTSAMLAKILQANGINRFALFGNKRITSSDHTAIHPLSAPPDQHRYNTAHGFKPRVTFSKPLFRETVCVIAACASVDPATVLACCRGMVPLHEISQASGGPIYTPHNAIADLRLLSENLVLDYLKLKRRVEKQHSRRLTFRSGMDGLNSVLSDIRQHGIWKTVKRAANRTKSDLLSRYDGDEQPSVLHASGSYRVEPARSGKNPARGAPTLSVTTDGSPWGGISFNMLRRGDGSKVAGQFLACAPAARHRISIRVRGLEGHEGARLVLHVAEQENRTLCDLEFELSGDWHDLSAEFVTSPEGRFLAFEVVKIRDARMVTFEITNLRCERMDSAS
jgi:hypothetical protein